MALAAADVPMVRWKPPRVLPRASRLISSTMVPNFIRGLVTTNAGQCSLHSLSPSHFFYSFSGNGVRRSWARSLGRRGRHRHPSPRRCHPQMRIGWWRTSSAGACKIFALSVKPRINLLKLWRVMGRRASIFPVWLPAMLRTQSKKFLSTTSLLIPGCARFRPWM